MASHYAMILSMSSQHRDPPLNVRPPTADRTAATDALTERGKDMTGFVTACLRALAANPDRLLRQLAPHWPEPKPRGRPPRAPRPGDGP